jgi:hypothetical protein
MMLIALLAVLGVDLFVIVLLLALVFSRKRWVLRQSGVFRGVIRVAGGEVDGLRPKWSRGYGRWVRDVLVWTKAPLLFRNELLPSDGLDAAGPADAGKVRRLGDQPTMIRLKSRTATIEVAADGANRELLLGPHRELACDTDSGARKSRIPTE